MTRTTALRILAAIILVSVAGAALYVTVAYIHARQFVREAAAIRIGDPVDSIISKLTKNADEVEREGDCRTACSVAFTYDNQGLARLGFRKAHLYLRVRAEGGKVAHFYLAYVVTFPSPFEGGYGVAVEVVPIQRCDVPFKLFRPTGIGKQPPWRVVLTPAASPNQVHAAFDLNLRCVMTRWGCRAPKYLLSREIADMPESGGEPYDRCVGSE